jgi:hypothetical protein
MLLGVRVVLFQSLEGHVNADDLLSDILASVWSALVNVVIFLMCALLGYFLGIQASNAAFGESALQELAQHYPVGELIRLCIRTGHCCCRFGLARAFGQTHFEPRQRSTITKRHAFVMAHSHLDIVRRSRRFVYPLAELKVPFN